jgi:hypothetical protein
MMIVERKQKEERLMGRKPYTSLELAQAYIPYQYYTDSYTPKEALRKGTLFPELYRPYLPGKGRR